MSVGRYLENPLSCVPGMTRMHPFSRLLGPRASHTVTMRSYWLSRPSQKAESSCHGVARPTCGSFEMKWLVHKAMSGPPSGSRGGGDPPWGKEFLNRAAPQGG